VRELAGKVVEAIGQAAAHMVPVAAGSGSGEERTISHYRRLLADDGHVVMNWEPYPAEHIVGPLGQIDPEVGVLKLVDEGGQVICLLFNHAGHPNVLSGDNYLLSAEYPGLAERLLECEFGGTAIFLNGAQGTMDIDGLRDRDWEGMERVGTALAGAVAEVARSIRVSWDASLHCASAHYALPARRITAEEWAWAEGVLEETGGSVRALADGVGDDYRATFYQRLREAEGHPIPVEQICVRIADTAWLSFPGELFTEIGMAIKAGSPFEHTYIVGLANGVVGYIPTRQAIQEGGYAVDTRRVDTDAERIVVGKSLNLLQSVRRSSMGGSLGA
jgi:neutral ceramidase